MARNDRPSETQPFRYGAPLSTDRAVVSSATGDYKTTFLNYVLRVHQAAIGVTNEGINMKRFTSENAFRPAGEAGWFSGEDRFGPVTEIRLPADGKEYTALSKNSTEGHF